MKALLEIPQRKSSHLQHRRNHFYIHQVFLHHKFRFRLKVHPHNLVGNRQIQVLLYKYRYSLFRSCIRYIQNFRFPLHRILQYLLKIHFRKYYIFVLLHINTSCFQQANILDGILYKLLIQIQNRNLYILCNICHHIYKSQY